MSRLAGSAALLALVAAVAAPAARPGFPTAYAAQGGAGLTSPDGTLRFVAERASLETTQLVARTVRGGTTTMSRALDGSFGIPMLRNGLPALGMFRDGSRFVLQSTQRAPTTTLQIIRTADLAVDRTIELDGAFSFDALSPDGKKLYLIQYQSADDVERYVVRLYDLAGGALVAGRVADATQKSWVMRGFVATRTESRDGRWVYTLYANPAGFPFVHALDTVNGTARCVGFAWKGQQAPLMGYRLAVKGGKLLVQRPGGSVYRSIDRTTYSVRAP